MTTGPNKSQDETASPGLRRAVLAVLLLNLGYFGVEFTVARSIGSVSLFADSIDFLEDSAINLLIFVALGWSAKARAILGMLLGGIILVPSVATIWTAWEKVLQPLAPDPFQLSLTGFGALVVNLLCAFLLVRFRSHSGSLTKAAFLSARNDALANVAILLAALVTSGWRTGWPDLVVGVGIMILNADAAMKIWKAAHKELSTSGEP